MAALLPKLFVYGTLRRGFPLHHYLEEASPRFLGRGTIRGRLYDLGEYPGAIKSTRSADEIEGELFELTDPVEQFKRLDEIEEYSPDRPGESLFLRERVNVRLETGETVEAWAYFLPAKPADARLIPSGNYGETRRTRA